MNFTQQQQSLIQIFQDKLLAFNESYNLIGKSTIDDFYNRHVIDSAQIINFIDQEQRKFIDFGAGAGFPSIIMAILRPDCEFHLIEKSFRKGQFLAIMADIIPNIKIYQNKIQDLEEVKYDVVTARAFASLNKIIQLSQRFLTKNSKLILHKGKKFQEEIDEAKQKFKFEIEVKDSISSAEGKILIITDLCLNS
jgi:16S rRNA (guanine527-N7)-methyltransferase